MRSQHGNKPKPAMRERTYRRLFSVFVVMRYIRPSGIPGCKVLMAATQGLPGKCPIGSSHRIAIQPRKHTLTSLLQTGKAKVNTTKAEVGGWPAGWREVVPKTSSQKADDLRKISQAYHGLTAHLIRLCDLNRIQSAAPHLSNRTKCALGIDSKV